MCVCVYVCVVRAPRHYGAVSQVPGLHVHASLPAGLAVWVGVCVRACVLGSALAIVLIRWKALLVLRCDHAKGASCQLEQPFKPEQRREEEEEGGKRREEK